MKTLEQKVTRSGPLSRIIDEHRRFRALKENLVRVRLMADARAAVSRLVEALPRHFESEVEEGGLYQEIQALAPRFAYELRRLEAEHEDILNEGECLARDLVDKREDARACLERAHRFARSLVRHGERENDLIQQVYFQDIGFSQ